MKTIQDILDWLQTAEDEGIDTVGTQNVKRHLESLQKEQLLIQRVSGRLSDSLGECSKGNDYEIIAEKDGKFWINHKIVGSGEPLKQWIDSVLNDR